MTRPELDEPAQAFLQAFELLSTGRPMGFASPQPIPMADIVALWTVHPLGDAFRFCAIMRDLDGLYLAKAAERRPKK